jgi:hypothetical protein
VQYNPAEEMIAAGMPTMTQKLDFFQVIEGACRDGVTAIRRMPRMFLSALGLWVAMLLVKSALTLPLFGIVRGLSSTTIWSRILLIDVAAAFVTGLICAPVAVAIQRFVLLGEITGSGFFKWTPRVKHFYLWLVSFGLLQSLLLDAYNISRQLSHPGIAWPLLFAMCVVEYFFVRLSLLFPAISADAPGAHYRACMHDTQRHFWFIFGSLLCSALLLAVLWGAALLAGVLLEKLGVPRLVQLFYAVIMVGALAMFTGSMSATLSAWLFRRYASHLLSLSPTA